MALKHIGGSFAPSIDDVGIATYGSLIASCEDLEAKDILQKLHTMLTEFRKTPESSLTGAAHPAGRGVMVPLEDAEIQRIWDVVPWQYEIEAYKPVLDRLDPVAQKDLRNAAFHLLWFAQELCLDREPLTKDRL